MIDTFKLPASTIRTRHFRERQRAGIRLVQFEVLPEEINTFIRTGLITASQRNDRAGLAKAFERILQDWMRRQHRTT